MAKYRGLMLWTDAWIADTMHLTRCQRGTYFDLLVLMWRSPRCRVPNDDIWLAQHLRMTQAEVENELRPIIFEFCKTDGNFIWQKRLLRERKFSDLQSARAKSRWHNKKVDATAADASVTVTVAEESKKDIPPIAPLPAQPPPLTRRRNIRTCLADDWLPKQGVAESDAVEFGRFRDYCRAHAKQYADWEAAWRNWKTSPYRTTKNGDANGRAGSILAAADRLIERLGGHEAAARYVPGSQGPRPISLDRGTGTANLRLISSG